MKFSILCALVFLSLYLTGCSSTFKPENIDEKTGAFPTSSELEAKDITVRKPFNPQYLSLLYVKTNPQDAKKWDIFWIESFKNMHEFSKVVSPDELQKLVIDQNAAQQVSSISDGVGLHNLSKVIGPFLTVEAHVEFKGGYHFDAELKATDPVTGDVVFDAVNDATNWSGLDQPLLYPLLNAFIAWTHDRPVSSNAH